LVASVSIIFVSGEVPLYLRISKILDIQERWPVCTSYLKVLDEDVVSPFFEGLEHKSIVLWPSDSPTYIW